MNWKDYLNFSISLRNIIISISLLFILTASCIRSQTEHDTLESVQSNDTTFVMTKSPWGAVLRSALLPGWGQFYNESYWKIPVVWGFLGYFSYIWLDQNDLYIKYKDLYRGSLEQTGQGNSEYLGLREFYRDQRDEFAVYFFLTYFLNLVDAYVDAHLFDFDVSYNSLTSRPQLNLHFRLK